jgi:hypothetical protein
MLDNWELIPSTTTTWIDPSMPMTPINPSGGVGNPGGYGPPIPSSSGGATAAGSNADLAGIGVVLLFFIALISLFRG